MAGIKRRGFLAMLGAAGLAPALPAGGTSVAAAGYNRYMYGLAVFHARTRASLSAADLIARLKVNAVQAEALMGEMTARGVVAPVAHAAGGVVRAIDPNGSRPVQSIGKTLRKVADWIDEDTAPADEETPPTAEAEAQTPDAGQETDHG